MADDAPAAPLPRRDARDATHAHDASHAPGAGEPAADALSRRRFVGWLSAVLAAGTVGAHPAGASGADAGADAPSDEASADALLAALGDAVLPSELGAEGIARAVDGFDAWMREYRSGAELDHGYGTARIEHLPPNPAPRWRSQLRALDAQARRAHGRSFARLDRPARQALVRARLAAVTGDALPAPAQADHVALALLAWFYESTAANDLCHRREIGRRMCRPLADQRREPLPLRRAAARRAP